MHKECIQHVNSTSLETRATWSSCSVCSGPCFRPSSRLYWLQGTWTVEGQWRLSNMGACWYAFRSSVKNHTLSVLFLPNLQFGLAVTGYNTASSGFKDSSNHNGRIWRNWHFGCGTLTKRTQTCQTQTKYSTWKERSVSGEIKVKVVCVCWWGGDAGEQWWNIFSTVWDFVVFITTEFHSISSYDRVI